MDLTLRLIMFHHSLEGLDHLPNMVNLSPSEKRKWCDFTFFNLVKVLMIADNESYVLFDEPHRERCRKQILAKVSAIQQACSERSTAEQVESEAHSELTDFKNDE